MASVMQKLDPRELAFQNTLRQHQDSAPKLDSATEVRTLVEYNHGYAVISTNSFAMPGYPGGAVVGFAPDEKGRPIFSFSGMSTHTQDLRKDGRCSLTVASKEFKGAADGRVNLIGVAKKIESEEEIEAATAIYKKKHPNAFWVDFGDFTWFRMEVELAPFVLGFARAGRLSAEEYGNAQPDAISAYGPGVAKHMNEDHRSSTVAIVRKYVGIDVDDAEIMSMDSLGMFVKITRTAIAMEGAQPQQMKIRVPFTQKLVDRKDAHTVIVEMSKASAEFLPKKAESAA